MIQTQIQRKSKWHIPFLKSQKYKYIQLKSISPSHLVQVPVAKAFRLSNKFNEYGPEFTIYFLLDGWAVSAFWIVVMSSLDKLLNWIESLPSGTGLPSL